MDCLATPAAVKRIGCDASSQTETGPARFPEGLHSAKDALHKMEIKERMQIIILAAINNLIILIALQKNNKRHTFGEIDPKEHLTLVNMALGHLSP